MILGAFGDSFLWGSDLHDCHNGEIVGLSPSYSYSTYSALLAKKLNFDYYCKAFPGQGNKIIADDILRTISSRKNTVFYLINWTWIDRLDYIGTENFGEINEGWCTLRPTSDCKKAEFFYKNLYKDIDAKLLNLMYIKTVLDALKENDCKFIMTFMDYLIFDKKYNTSSSIEYLQNKIKPYVQNFDDMNFLDWSKKNNFAISDNWHPLEDAHRASAEYWLPKVRTLLNTSAKEEKPNASK